MSVLSECVQFKFDVLGTTYIKQFRDATEFTKGLLVRADRTSLLFTSVVGSRTIVRTQDGMTFTHELCMWEGKGPFTSKEFLLMLQFSPQFSNAEWQQHMETCWRKVPYVEQN